jgi:FixJ family two-component response regulator
VYTASPRQPASAKRAPRWRFTSYNSSAKRGATIARGQSNSDIGSTLVVSEATVKTHLNRLFSKLNLRGRVQAVMLAYQTGPVQPGERANERTQPCRM